MNNIFQIRFAPSRSGDLKSKVKNPKWVGIVAINITFALLGVVAEAQQQPNKVPRIGYLQIGSRPGQEDGDPFGEYSGRGGGGQEGRV